MIGGEFSACLFQHKRSTEQFKYLVRCFNCLAERFNFLAKNLHWKNRAKELIYKKHIDPDWNREKLHYPLLRITMLNQILLIIQIISTRIKTTLAGTPT